MPKNGSAWWYSRVAASPNPEAYESVNVGLLLGDSRPRRLATVPKLPRLTCLVSPGQVGVFESILAALEEDVARGTEVPTLRALYGPQIMISEPRTLMAEPDRRLVSALKRRLLETPSDSATVARTRRGGRAEDRRAVERVLGRAAQLGWRVEKGATPAGLYPDVWRDVFPTRVSRAAVALRSKRELQDVIVDGLLIRPERPRSALRAASPIGQMFWEYKRNRQALRALTGREVRTVGIVANGADRNSGAVAEARAYIRHIWELDADLIVEEDRSGDIEALQIALRTARW